MSSEARRVFSVLARTAAVSQAETTDNATAIVDGTSTVVATNVPAGLLAAHLQATSIIPGLGIAIVGVAFGEANGVFSDAQRLGFPSFQRGIERCAGSERQRMVTLFEVLAAALDGADGRAHRKGIHTVEDRITAVLELAYRLETSTHATTDEPFRCAAGRAAIIAGSATGAAMAERFADWALDQLPGLAQVLAIHVSQLCDRAEGLDAATLTNEAVQRSRGVGAALHLQSLLAMDPADARRCLAKQSQLPPDRLPHHQPPPPSPPHGAVDAPAPASAANATTTAAATDSTERCGGGGGGASCLMKAEWLWLISHALDLPASLEIGAIALASQWSRLFSSDVDGRSLHTLSDKTVGYSNGCLLIATDSAGFTFGGWSPTGLNPNPPSTSSSHRDVNFVGSDQCALLRLRPSLLVCRSRRTLAAAAAAAAALPPPPSRALSAQEVATSGVPADRTLQRPTLILALALALALTLALTPQLSPSPSPAPALSPSRRPLCLL